MTEWFIGMAASLGDVILSGFVSIYFEKVLKSKTETYSVWDRNFQLAFWSMVIYMPIMFYDNPQNPFAGWSGTRALAHWPAGRACAVHSHSSALPRRCVWPAHGRFHRRATSFLFGVYSSNGR